MILSPKALDVVFDKKVRREISEELDLVDQTVLDYRKANRPNGPLTTYAVLRILEKHSGLKDSDLLVNEEDTVVSTA